VANRRRGESRCSGRVGLWSCVAGDSSGCDGCGHASRRDIGARAQRSCRIANSSGSLAERFLWRVNNGPRYRRRQIRARGFAGSLCFGQYFDWGAFRPLSAGQCGRAGFNRGSLHAEAGPLIETGPLIRRRIELRRGTGLRPFECGRSGSCGCSRSLDFSGYEKCRQENV
jgi:hypothetical protein